MKKKHTTVVKIEDNQIFWLWWFPNLITDGQLVVKKSLAYKRGFERIGNPYICMHASNVMVKWIIIKILFA